MTDPPRTRARRRHGSLATWAFLVLLAAATALVTMSPPLRFERDHPDAAADGIVFHEAKDAELRVAQIGDVAAGTWGRANDFLFEGARDEGRAPPWTCRLLAWVHGYKGADLHWVVVWASGAAAALHVLLFFLIGRTLRLSGAASLAVAALACLAPFLWSSHGAEWWLGRPWRVQTPFLPLYRPVDPALSSLPLWGGVLALLRWMRRPSLLAWIGLAVLLGVLWTAYPPAFLFLAAFVGGAAAGDLFAKRWRGALALLGAVCAATAVNAAAIHSASTAVSARAPLLTADVATLLVLSVAWFLLRHGRAPDAPRRAFLFGACLGMLAVSNLDVITGRPDRPVSDDGSWPVPLVWTSAALLAAELRVRLRGVARRLAAGRLAAVLAYTIVGGTTALLVLVHGGETTGRLLRAAGALRAESVPRPWMWTGVVLAAAAALVLLVRWTVGHRWRCVAALLAAALAGFALSEGFRIQDLGYRSRKADVASRAPLARALRRLAALARPDDIVACSNDVAASWVSSYTGRKGLAPFGPARSRAESLRASRADWVLWDREPVASGLPSPEADPALALVAEESSVRLYRVVR